MVMEGVLYLTLKILSDASYEEEDLLMMIWRSSCLAIAKAADNVEMKKLAIKEGIKKLKPKNYKNTIVMTRF